MSLSRSVVKQGVFFCFREHRSPHLSIVRQHLI